MTMISQALEIAQQIHRAGNLREAENKYLEILQQEPTNADVWHLLGITACQRGNYQGAIDNIQKAVELAPSNPLYHTNLGMAYHECGKVGDAVTAQRRAIHLKPDLAEAYNNLGRGLAALGNLPEAISSYQESLRLQPHSAEAHNNLAAAFKEQGRLEEAAVHYQRAIQLKPNQAVFHNHLGELLSLQGKFAEAAACYQHALRFKPDYAEAEHNLGRAFKAQGKLAEAITCYQAALQFKPDYAEAHHSLGNAFRGQESSEKAAASLREAIRIRPGYIEAHNDLGNILKEEGKLEEAAACFTEALRYLPNHAVLHNNLGTARAAQDRLDEAIFCYREALRLQPDYADALNNLGNALKDQNKLEEALTCYRDALRIRPDHAVAYNNLGTAMFAQRKYDESVAACKEAIRLKPDYAEAHFNLGQALQEQKKYAEAAVCYEQALLLQPENATFHNNMGNAFTLLDQPERAVVSYRQAIKLQPELAVLYSNLGNALTVLGKPDESAIACREALRLKPDYADAHHNLGIALQAVGQLEKGLTHTEEALRLQPDYPEARLCRSMVWLVQGKYEQGWPEYEWRWKDRKLTLPPLPEPQWDGSAFEGKTVLLRAEQGLGDALQFVRYAPLVKERGGKVILECHKQLTRILADCAGIDQVVARGSPLPPYDMHVPLLSLPRIFGTTVETVPCQIPYLHADPGLEEHWRRELSQYPGFKIGIVWQGRPTFGADRMRSIPLTQFGPLARLPGVQLFSLQKGQGTEQLESVAYHFPVIELGSRLDETTGAFMDTAAVVNSLDLVISPDTAMTHLAGGLGRPVWLALSVAGDWRWLLERETSPWYPTVKIFRQKEIKNWQEVFDRMAGEVKKMLPAVQDKTTITVPAGLTTSRTISIITPWRDHPELITDFEKAVRGAQVIVIDNGSSSENAAQIKAMVTRLGGIYVRNETNAGFAVANNQGLAHTRGDIIVFLNNDVVANADFLAAVHKDVREGTLFGPSLHQLVVYGLWLPYLEGWCIAGKRSDWEKIGGWDGEAYPDPYWEDNDLCFRALQLGIQLAGVTWPIQHKGGQTTGAPWKQGEGYERNRATFAARVKPYFDRWVIEQGKSDEPAMEPSLAKLYKAACTTPSDINEHCSTLSDLARNCRHVTELGTQATVSTTALLHGQPDRFVRYAKASSPELATLRACAGHTEFLVYLGDPLQAPIQETDMLFIDTFHVYEQLKKELQLHAAKVRKYIVLHDTTTFGEDGEVQGSRGLWQAVEEFVKQGQFRLKARYENNNGLTVLERVEAST